MPSNPQAEASLKALQDIRGIMARSERFLSLSGWSGVWAGSVALVSAAVAWTILIPGDIMHMRLGLLWMRDGQDFSIRTLITLLGDSVIVRALTLAVITFLLAFAGAYFFTWRKAQAQGQKIWNRTSRQLMWQVIIPMAAGGIFCIAFLCYGALSFIAPACLAFYGLALINGSKYTLGEIRWLGYCELLLGCIALFVPYYGFLFMAAGFGLLHILYGIVMWNKYDKPGAQHNDATIQRIHE